MIKICRINMCELKIKEELVPEKYEILGGRGLTSQVLLDEVDPMVYPLSQENKLIIAPGLFSGTSVPSSGRLSVGSKSPLTGGIKESNAGGTASTRLANLGIKGLIIEGKPLGNKKYILHISHDSMKLLPAEDIWGMGNYETVRHLKEKFGEKSTVMSIGQAGENQMRTATIAVTDMDGRPARHCGRGGLGAVMGSKGLKAIVIDYTNEKQSIIKIKDMEGFKEISKTWAKTLIETRKTMTAYGTSITMNAIDAIGGLPTRNFSRGQFEHVDKINGYGLHEKIKENGGKQSHACSPGCVIRCSNVYLDKEGNHVTSGLEYETLCLLGSNCEISNIDAIARFDHLCDDYGIDTMEVGCTMGVAMEAGILEFGDYEGVERLINEIGKSTTLGRILGQGTLITGQVFNVEHIPVVKGQGLASYDPRVLKGTGVTYATTPMGADHTAGNLIPGRGGVEFDKAEGQIEASRNIQAYAAVQDSMGLCNFTGSVVETMDIVAKLLNAALGTDFIGSDITSMGRRVVESEREFNLRAGMNKIDDRLPAFFKKEELAPTGNVFDVTDEDIDSIYV